MDLYQPPPKFETSDVHPYLSYVEREAYKRLDKAELYQRFKSRATKNSPNIEIHIPFTQQEHELVIQYLALMKFLSPTVYQHNFPIQLEQKLKQRNRYHIQNYICDLIARGSASYEEGEPIIAYKPRTETKSIEKTIQIESWENVLAAAQIQREKKEVIGIKHISYASFVVYMKDIQPIVIVCNKLSTTKNKAISTLLTQGLNFIDSYETCTTNGNWAALYHTPSFYLFDFTHPGTVKAFNTFSCTKLTEESTIPTPFIQKATAADTQNEDGETIKLITIPSRKTNYKFLAEIQDGPLALYTCSPSEQSSVQPVFLLPDKTKFACFTDSDRIIAIHEDNDVYEFDKDGKCINRNQIDEESYENEPVLRLPDYEFIECKGDALVFKNGTELIIFPFKTDSESRQTICPNESKKLMIPDVQILACSFAYDVIAFVSSEAIFICNSKNSINVKSIALPEKAQPEKFSLWPLVYATPENHPFVAFAVITSQMIVYSENGTQLFKPLPLSQDPISEKCIYVHPSGQFLVYASQTDIRFITFEKLHLFTDEYL